LREDIMRMGHFGLGTLLALIILIATTEAVIAVNTITKDMATDSRVIPRQLSDLTADEEERCGRRSQCDPWWGNFKAWFKKTFYFWRRNETSSARRLR
ncbi:hypothetical protein PC115_g25283, partial [Phytophthora cactorum]